MVCSRALWLPIESTRRTAKIYAWQSPELGGGGAWQRPLRALQLPSSWTPLQTIPRRSLGCGDRLGSPRVNGSWPASGWKAGNGSGSGWSCGCRRRALRRPVRRPGGRCLLRQPAKRTRTRSSERGSRPSLGQGAWGLRPMATMGPITWSAGRRISLATCSWSKLIIGQES